MMFASGALAWRGQVTQVDDTDLITVIHDGKTEKIRLYGIDCPKLDQPSAVQAKVIKSFLMVSKFVEITPESGAPPAAVDALVRVDGTREFVNEKLVAYGMAWVKESACNSQMCQGWRKLQELAKINAIGLWMEVHPVPPWEWRQQRSIRKLPGESP
jgi:micrococcal nuclease